MILTGSQEILTSRAREKLIEIPMFPTLLLPHSLLYRGQSFSAHQDVELTATNSEWGPMLGNKVTVLPLTTRPVVLTPYRKDCCSTHAHAPLKVKGYNIKEL